MKCQLATGFLFTTVAICIGAQNATTKPSISTVHTIYVQDQRDRGVIMAENGDKAKPSETSKQPEHVSWDEITRHDAERRKQVHVLLANDQITSAQDFRDASFIFQHGQTADDYLLAHVLAVEAIVRGDTASKWIAAATLDRYLQTIGQKQVFGTQFGDAKYAYYLQHRGDADLVEKLKSIPSATTQHPYNENLIPPVIRKDFCVPDLLRQQQYVDNANTGKSPEIPRIEGCAR